MPRNVLNAIKQKENNDEASSFVMKQKLNTYVNFREGICSVKVTVVSVSSLYTFSGFSKYEMIQEQKNRELHILVRGSKYGENTTYTANSVKVVLPKA